jgi:hypothetical protein
MGARLEESRRIVGRRRIIVASGPSALAMGTRQKYMYLKWPNSAPYLASFAYGGLHKVH